MTPGKPKEYAEVKTRIPGVRLRSPVVFIIRHREEPGRAGWLTKWVSDDGGYGSHGGSALGGGNGGRCCGRK